MVRHFVCADAALPGWEWRRIVPSYIFNERTSACCSSQSFSPALNKTLLIASLPHSGRLLFKIQFKIIKTQQPYFGLTRARLDNVRCVIRFRKTTPFPWVHIRMTLIQLSIPGVDRISIRISNGMQIFRYKRLQVASVSPILKLFYRTGSDTFIPLLITCDIYVDGTLVSAEQTVGSFRVSATDAHTLALSVLVTFNWLTGLHAAESSQNKVNDHYLITIIDFIQYNALSLAESAQDEYQHSGLAGIVRCQTPATAAHLNI